MPVLDEADWDLINAYHDGELEPAQQLAFERRLQSDPNLADALREVELVSNSLEALRPENFLGQAAMRDEQIVKTRPRSWRFVTACGVAAASIVAIIFLLPNQKPTFIALHDNFVSQEFALPSQATIPISNEVDRPDLASAGLTFVSSRSTHDVEALHYVGKNGCRLTFVRMAKYVAVDDSFDIQSKQWRSGDQHFAVLAEGMDLTKFEAIANYLESKTNQDALDETLLALRAATQNASQCA